MNRYYLIGVLGFVLTAGPACAQSVSSETSTTTQSTVAPASAPVISNTWSTSSKKSFDSNGNEIDKTKSYTSGSNGSRATASSVTTAPDGSSVNSSHEERTASPDGDTSETKQTTTTTSGQ